MNRSDIDSHTYDGDFELLKLKDGGIIGMQSRLAKCARCENKGILTLTEDPNADIFGFMSGEDVLFDGPGEVVCTECSDQDFNEAMDEQIIDTLERKLSLDERHREGLKELIKTVFTDPDKILRLPLLESDLRKMEERLEDQRKQNSWQLALLGVITTVFAALLTVATILLAT